MDPKQHDTGIIIVLLQRFEKQRLPLIVEMELRLENGDNLSEFDIDYLSDALHDARKILPYLDRHQEYRPLLAKVMHYYKEITDTALSNEKLVMPG